MVVLALGVGECVPGAFFSAPFRKLLLGRERLVDADLAAIDASKTKTFRQIREAEDVSQWGLTFVEPEVTWPGDEGGNLGKPVTTDMESGRIRFFSLRSLFF